MALSGKQKLQLADVAPDLARMILKSISEESLSELQDWGVNPDSREHKLEILILGLYALRVSAQEGLRHVQKNYVALLYFTEQDIKTIYVEVLKYGTSHQFEETLQDRYREYDSIMESTTTEDRKLQCIGSSFVKHIGTTDAALIYWSSKTFIAWVGGYTKFLSNLDSQFELVADDTVEVDTIRCPRCTRVNPENTLLCNCGYDFQSGKVVQSHPLAESTDLPATQKRSSVGKSAFAVTVCLIVLAAFAIFVWPTRYQYTHMNGANGVALVVRIDRFTGDAEWFDPGSGWVAQKEKQETKSQSMGLASVLLRGKASLDGKGMFPSFSGDIYNGSKWRVTRIIFSVTAKKKDGSMLWNRQFDHPISIFPLSTSSFSVTILREPQIASFEWDIIEAYGEPPQDQP